MAENSTIAFGRYLKMIRGRRNLSLQEVTSLSDSFPDPINKGYLSRCENGHQKISLNKVIPLSRIYEVPSDVIVERLELDMEVDRLGAPDTEGRTFESLRAETKEIFNKGFALEAYALMRDSLPLASKSPILPRYRDHREQFAFAITNCATAARSLNKIRFALHEFLFVLSLNHAGPELHAFILERVADAYLYNNQLDAANRYIKAALAEAVSIKNYEHLAHAFGTRAQIAYRAKEFSVAIEFYKKCYEESKRRDRKKSMVIAMNSLGQIYLDQGRIRGARRLCSAARHLAEQNNLVRSLTFSLLVLGRVDSLECRPQQASEKLRHAQELCKETGDRSARFAVEVALLKLALSEDNSSSVRSAVRRLDRIVPHVSWAVDELAEYREILRIDVPRHLLP